MSQLPLSTSSTGTALLLAALRQDYAGMAHLLARATPQELIDLAAYCATFAASQSRRLDELHSGSSTESALQIYALQRASQTLST